MSERTRADPPNCARPFRRQMNASAASRTGRSGAGWQWRWAQVLACLARRDARPAGGGADVGDCRDRAYFQKSPVCRAGAARWRNTSPGKVLSRGCRGASGAACKSARALIANVVGCQCSPARPPMTALSRARGLASTRWPGFMVTWVFGGARSSGWGDVALLVAAQDGAIMDVGEQVPCRAV